jgi:hypothetical protein
MLQGIWKKLSRSGFMGLAIALISTVITMVLYPFVAVVQICSGKGFGEGRFLDGQMINDCRSLGSLSKAVEIAFLSLVSFGLFSIALFVLGGFIPIIALITLLNRHFSVRFLTIVLSVLCGFYSLYILNVILYLSDHFLPLSALVSELEQRSLLAMYCTFVFSLSISTFLVLRQFGKSS